MLMFDSFSIGSHIRLLLELTEKMETTITKLSESYFIEI